MPRVKGRGTGANISGPGSEKKARRCNVANPEKEKAAVGVTGPFCWTFKIEAKVARHIGFADRSEFRRWRFSFRVIDYYCSYPAALKPMNLSKIAIKAFVRFDEILSEDKKIPDREELDQRYAELFNDTETSSDATTGPRNKIEKGVFVANIIRAALNDPLFSEPWTSSECSKLQAAAVAKFEKATGVQLPAFDLDILRQRPVWRLPDEHIANEAVRVINAFQSLNNSISPSKFQKAFIEAQDPFRQQTLGDDAKPAFMKDEVIASPQKLAYVVFLAIWDESSLDSKVRDAVTKLGLDKPFSRKLELNADPRVYSYGFQWRNQLRKSLEVLPTLNISSGWFMINSEKHMFFSDRGVVTPWPSIQRHIADDVRMHQTLEIEIHYRLKIQPVDQPGQGYELDGPS